MSHSTAPELLKLLAHDLRWHILCMLTEGDYRVNEIVARVGEPPNIISYHLKQLRDAKIVTKRRSDADGRDIYYHLNLSNLQTQFQHVGGILHPALGNMTVVEPMLELDGDPVRVLILCTHNSARSQMAEGFMRYLGGDSVAVYSAGSHPTAINSDAIATMDDFGIDIRQQQSSHINEYLQEEFDYVITVCDYAREVCPSFNDGSKQRHWGYPDPSTVRDEVARERAFKEVALGLKSRVTHFLQGLHNAQLT